MITIHNRSNGSFLTTLSCVADRSWVTNNKGKCTIVLSNSDPKATKKIMLTRNLISITHPKLPLWAGVIETDQEWDYQGKCTYTAWSGESLLIGRTPTIGKMTASTPGALYEQLIALANENEDTLIRPGEIEKSGGSAEVTLDGTNLFEVILDLATRHDMEFSITPRLSNNNTLIFDANWQPRFGTLIPRLIREGYNAKKPSRPLRVTRRVVNKLTAIGEGSTEETRPMVTVQDDNSIGLFGLMEGVEDFDGITDRNALRVAAMKRLRVLRYPKYTVGVSVLDVDDTFSYMKKGNSFVFESSSYGFQASTGIGFTAKLRIMSMRYLERVNELEIKNNTEDFEL